MRKNEREDLKLKLVNIPYQCAYFKDYDYSILDIIPSEKRIGCKRDENYSQAIMMLDTETSKSIPNTVCYNYVVAWTLSIRFLEHDFVTLWGTKPSDLVETVIKLHRLLEGDHTIFYVHNLSYDWVFLRKFLFKKLGYPEKQLNTKPHYPIYIRWDNGLILKDSYILSQRSLDKWAKDLDVVTKKAVGKWDYNKIRHQNEIYTGDELEYIEHDTLAGVQCIEKTMQMLHKHLYSLPYTATGIPREECRKRGAENNARAHFMKQHLSFSQYHKMLKVYHGGYTHANRHMIGWVQGSPEEPVKAYDKASSYPFQMLTKKVPCERFVIYKNCSMQHIVDNSDEYAFIFKLKLIRVRLKSDSIPMPALQFSKCVKTINEIQDNGRILCADYLEIYLNEIDLLTIIEQYDCDAHICQEVEVARKDYIPRWLTDYVFELFEKKTSYKGGDKVLYNLSKATLNSVYGMCVQKSIRDDNIENYKTGEYGIVNKDTEEEYEKYIHNRNSILLYQVGCWITSWAQRELFLLGACCDEWIYSDTDSVYGLGWHEDKIAEYNQYCKELLQANNYGCAMKDGKEYWLGVAELDSVSSEFVTLGAKRYCARHMDDGELHITVAGVPKKGVLSLNDDIMNFKEGLVFSGEVSGKNGHTFFIEDDIRINEYGDEVGDSIDLSPCSYLMDSVKLIDWEEIFTREIEVQNYEERGQIF